MIEGENLLHETESKKIEAPMIRDNTGSDRTTYWNLLF